MNQQAPGCLDRLIEVHAGRYDQLDELDRLERAADDLTGEELNDGRMHLSAPGDPAPIRG